MDLTIRLINEADDKKVEAFYLKNGFSPVALVAKGRNGEEFKRVSISDYDSGLSKKQELNKKYHPHEVIFIFEKILS